MSRRPVLVTVPTVTCVVFLGLSSTQHAVQTELWAFMLSTPLEGKPYEVRGLAALPAADPRGLEPRGASPSVIRRHSLLTEPGCSLVPRQSTRSVKGLHINI